LHVNESGMNRQAVTTLKTHLTNLPKGDQGFAADLLARFTKYGSLSEKQWHWVEKLSDAAETAGVPDFTKETVTVGEFGGVIDLFKKAKQYIKYPKITLQLPSGQPLQLSLAGQNSKAPGTINLTDGGSFGYNKWYGRVTPEGTWDPGPKVDEALKNDLTSILAKLANAPARTAAAYGKLTGNCCFCATPLTNENSTHVGYGPVCAKRWGLPWGKKEAA
jgi:hypothetical protein